MFKPTAIRRSCIMAAILGLLFLNTSCALKTQHKALHRTDDLESLQGLDGKSPWLKAHMPEGGLYLLSNWQIDEGQRIIKGTGSLMNARRDVIASGPFVVPLDSVAIFESNIVSTSAAVAGLTVMSVATAAMTIYCITNPKACFGSCPTFYANDEDGRSMMMAEGFSASVSPTLEESDLDALFGARPTGGKFTLTMTNEALETHVVRYTDLWVAPRLPGHRVLAAQDGTWWHAEAPMPAANCRGPEGDCTELLRESDGFERFSLADSLFLGTKEFVELDFTHIPDGDLGLVISSRHSLLSTFLFYQGLAYLGENAAPALVRLGPSGESGQGSKNLGDLLGKIEVQVPGPDGTWLSVGSTGETGPLAVNTHLLRLPKLNPADPRLRLKLTQGNWRIDYAALTVLENEVTPVRLSPAFVLQDGIADGRGAG